MIKRFALSALTLSIFLLASQAHAQVVNYVLDADNDLAFYVGNADATIFRQVVNKTTNWPEPVSGSFTLLPGEEYFYMLSLNYGGPGDIGGFLNDVSLVDMPSWVSKDITGQVTGFPSSEDPTFNPDPDEIRDLISDGNFNSGTPSFGFGTCSPILGTLTFVTPTGETATVYRQTVNVVVGAAAPEPGTLALLGLGGLTGGIVLRRRK